MNEKRFTKWLDDYGKAWVDGEPDAVVRLFAEGAHYHETPFDEPMVGREAIRKYWQEGAEHGQRDVEFKCDVAAVTGNTGYARWEATFVRVPSGSFVELQGFLQADFDGEGKCIAFREWWHRREGV